MTNQAESSGQKPWWDALPIGNTSSAESVEVTYADRQQDLQVRLSAWFDVGLRTAVSSAVGICTLPALLTAHKRDQDMERLAFYRDMVDTGDLARIFCDPPTKVAIMTEPVSFRDHPLPQPPSKLLTFRSPYQTLSPDMRASYSRHSRNTRVVAQHWTHPSGPRPTLIFTHGFGLNSYWVNAQMFALRWFYRKGYDILLYTLPFHGSRGDSLSPFSGAGYFMYGLSHSNEAMLQAVFDLRILIRHLRHQGVEKIGLSGLSLGGYISATTACVEKGLAFCVPNAPVVCPADMMMFEWWPTSSLIAAMRWRNGTTAETFRHSMALHCPLTWQPLLEPERLLIIAGAGDRLVPPHHIRLLHDHWQGSALHWFPGNHVIHLQQRNYLKLMLSFMNRCCDVTPTK
jgi:pimeloyl-ACP methyl ester carboxylesterase